MAVRQTLRVGLHQAWNQRCAYCHNFVFYDDLQIDHIVPESTPPDVLRRVIQEHGLRPDYDVRATYNLVPADRCNSRKWAHVPPAVPAISLLFQTAERLAVVAESFGARLRAQGQFEKALAIIDHQLARSDFSDKEWRALGELGERVRRAVAKATSQVSTSIGLSRALQPDFAPPVVRDAEDLLSADELIDLLTRWFDQSDDRLQMLAPLLAEGVASMPDFNFRIRAQRKRLVDDNEVTRIHAGRDPFEWYDELMAGYDDLTDEALMEGSVHVLTAEPSEVLRLGYSDERSMFAAHVRFDLYGEYVGPDGETDDQVSVRADLWIDVREFPHQIHDVEIATFDAAPFDVLDAMRQRARRSRDAAPIDMNEVRELALRFPGTKERLESDHIYFSVAGITFMDAPVVSSSVNVVLDADAIAAYIDEDPSVFGPRVAYGALVGVAVILEAVDRGRMATLVEAAWRRCAPDSLIEERDRADQGAR